MQDTWRCSAVCPTDAGVQHSTLSQGLIHTSCVVCTQPYTGEHTGSLSDLLQHNSQQARSQDMLDGMPNAVSHPTITQHTRRQSVRGTVAKPHLLQTRLDT